MVPGLGPGVLDQRPPGARYGRTGNLTSPADAQLLLARHFIKPPLWIFLFALSFDLVIRLICLKILWKFLFTRKLLHFGVSQPRKLLRESRTTGALISFPVTPSKLSLTQKDTKCLDAFFIYSFQTLVPRKHDAAALAETFPLISAVDSSPNASIKPQFNTGCVSVTMMIWKHADTNDRPYNLYLNVLVQYRTSGIHFCGEQMPKVKRFGFF